MLSSVPSEPWEPQACTAQRECVAQKDKSVGTSSKIVDTVWSTEQEMVVRNRYYKVPPIPLLSWVNQPLHSVLCFKWTVPRDFRLQVLYESVSLKPQHQ